jgi:hypothetical protein
MGGLAGFVLGVLGNLTATWIQQDILNNAFSTDRLLMISGLICLFLVAVVILEYFNISSDVSATTKSLNGSFRNLLLVWSKLKALGQKIALHNVASIKSEIEIDTRDNINKED